MIWQPRIEGASGSGRAPGRSEDPGRVDFTMDGVGLLALVRGGGGGGGLGLGRQAVLAALYTITGLLVAWFLSGEGGLGLEVSGDDGCLYTITGSGGLVPV